MITKGNTQRNRAPELLFKKLLAVMHQLRGPNGCPWDKKQSHQSIKSYLLEETYETYEALSNKHWKNLNEELGDLLFQIVFHAEMGAESNRFDISTILTTLIQKLTSRHPHVFGNGTVKNAAEVVLKWDELKSKETRQSLLDRIPKHMPALMQAYQLQDRAHRLGFKWNKLEEVKEKFEEELREWVSACRQGKKKNNMEEELGDVLFMLTNLGRWLRLNPEQALLKTNQKFRKRFLYIEKRAKQQRRQVKDFSPKELEAMWRDAKKTRRTRRK